MSTTRPMGCTWEEQQIVAKLLGGDDENAHNLAKALCNKWNAENTASANHTTMDTLTDTALSTSNSFVTNSAADGSFVYASGFLILFMQMGFMMLCTGTLHPKSSSNICLMNVLNLLLSCPVFLLASILIQGSTKPSDESTGSGTTAMINSQDMAKFFSQWAFAAATATITTGAVMDRMSLKTTIWLSIFMSAIVFPAVAHWVWSNDGWLTSFTDKPLLGAGMIDCAGSGCVHMVGGLATMMGVVMLGPRDGRFEASTGAPRAGFDAHSMTLVVLGTLTLWFGWFTLNPAIQLTTRGTTDPTVLARATVCTTLAASAAGIAALLFKKYFHGVWDLKEVCNGVLSGLVAISAGCSVVEPEAALMCGVVAAFVFEGATAWFLKHQIDDPLKAAPMHGFCGMWGLLFVGLMAKGQYVDQVFVHEELFHAKFGLLYGGGEQLLVSQFVGMISIAGWTCALMGAFFYVYKRCITCKADIENSLEGNHCHRYGEDLRLSEHVQFSSPQLHEALCALHQKSKTEAKIEQCNPTHAWHVNSVM